MIEHFLSILDYGADKNKTDRNVPQISTLI